MKKKKKKKNLAPNPSLETQRISHNAPNRFQMPKSDSTLMNVYLIHSYPILFKCQKYIFKVS